MDYLRVIGEFIARGTPTFGTENLIAFVHILGWNTLYPIDQETYERVTHRMTREIEFIDV